MTLGYMQKIFAMNVGKLIAWAYGQGYELSFGEAWRPPEMAEIYAKKGQGIINSLHSDRLAIDFNLFRDGVYMERSEDYSRLGEAWKQLHPLNRWGGDFTRLKDGNHFSMEWQGRQ